MTEAEWLVSSDPWEMMYPAILATQVTEDQGKDLLWKAACVRRVWHLLSDPFRHLVLELERHAEGSATPDEVTLARLNLPRWRNAAERIIADPGSWKWWERVDFLASEAVAGLVPLQDWEAGQKELYTAERRAQAHLLRDIFGNPFRPTTLDPAWRSSSVTALAQAIYADAAFDRLPILADALEDAGCSNQDILNHCRQPSVHVRGCWVVDLVLGKE